VDYMFPVIARARAGERVYHEATLVAFERHGRLEDLWFDMSYTPIRSGDGTVLGVQQTFLDRTDELLNRRRLQTLNRLAVTSTAGNRAEAVAAAVAVLADAEDVPFAAAYLLDPVRTQATCVAACGVDPGSSIAPRLLRITPGAVWPLHRVVEDKTEIVLDDVADRFRGHRVADDLLSPEQAVLHPLRHDVDGNVVGVLVLGVHPRRPLNDSYREFLTLVGDATAAKANEAHARQRERERAERLAELDRAKTTFFSNVSHEFRTPLTLMLAPLDEAVRRADELPYGLVDELEVALRNARRLLRLVGTLLDFSQVEAGRLRAHFLPTDLAALTGQIASMFRSAAETAGLKLTIDTPTLPEPVWVDPEMWEKIVSNLVSNALKFTWSGSVEVTLRALPAHAELLVHDTGVGIPTDQLPHVFKRFHRSPETRGRTHEGAGIGLALVQELVRRHHGRIRVTSEQGVGSTFTVWLPLGRRPEQAVELEPVTGRIAAAMAEEAAHWDAAREQTRHALGLDEETPTDIPRGHRPGARVLVVDDNSDMREYLVRLLGGAWDVTAAADGQEALELARRERPDLVLADVMMPGLDGFGLLAAIRADDGLAATPMVLLTARAGETTAIEGLLAGADDYIVKPFSARELIARVEAQLQLAAMRRQVAALDAYRLALTDALQSLEGPALIQRRAAEMVGRELNVDGAYFAEVERPTGLVHVCEGYTGAGTRVADTYPLPGWGGELLHRTLGQGRVLIVSDVGTHDIDEAGRAAWLSVGARAVVAAPLIRDGTWVAHLAVLQDRPRDWTPDEIALIEETAARTWAFVERARAEAALRDSEERMRMAIRATGIVTWEWVVSDDRITTSDNFATVYGLPALAGAEEGWALVLPEDAARHVKKVHAIAAEGGSYNSEFRIRRPDDGRIVWLEERAEARTGADGAVERVIGVTLDITERMQEQEQQRHRTSGKPEAAERAELTGSTPTPTPTPTPDGEPASRGTPRVG
jgi:PAS domain S-box-containing protein